MSLRRLVYPRCIVEFNLPISIYTLRGYSNPRSFDSVVMNSKAFYAYVRTIRPRHGHICFGFKFGNTWNRKNSDFLHY